MRYYEDLREGEERVSRQRAVDAQDMLEFARRYDPLYFHVDPEAARRSIFGEVIASGLYTITFWRQLDHEISDDIAWICGVGWDNVRFPVAVRAGDLLRARARCHSKRLSATRPERGVVVYEYVLENQRGETVFSCLSTNLVERRPARPQAPTHDGTPSCPSQPLS